MEDHAIEPTRKEGAYYPLLDVLRFFAALGVLSFHYFSHSPDPAHDPGGRAPMIYGHLGVQLFFMISGFVIVLCANPNLFQFARDRFLRLVPLFWVMCSLTYLGTILLPGGDPLRFPLFLRNLLMVSNMDSAVMVDPSYWTLTIEVIFYAYAGLFVFVCGKRRLHLFLLGWLGVIYLVLAAGWIESLPAKLLLGRQAPYFIVGGLAGYMVTYAKHLSASWNAGLVLGMVGAIALAHGISVDLAPQIQKLNTFAIYDRTSWAILLGLFAVFLLSIRLSTFVRNPAFVGVARSLGLITYPLYLIHQKIGMLLIGPSYGLISFRSLGVAMVLVVFSYYAGVWDFRFRLRVKNRLRRKASKPF